MRSFRLPRFIRMPHLPAPGPRPLLTWERMRFYLLGLALLIIAFFFGLYLFFPNEIIKERLTREIAKSAGIDVQIGSLSLLFPPGMRAERISVPLALPDRPTFDIRSVSVKPLWMSAFSSNPGAAFQARLLNGELSGWTRRDGSIEVDGRRLAFAQALVAGSAVELSGVLDQGAFTGVLPPKPTTESRFELVFDDMRINGMESLGVADGNMILGRIVCKGEGRGNNFRVEELAASGGEMLVTGSGSFMLNQPVERSRINLTVTLRPGTNFDQSLRDLLNLFANPGRDGSYSLRISGTLATPVFAK
ncbi:MAG: type II secretion system protein GspN [Desulfuromonadales bacterium]